MTANEMYSFWWKKYKAKRASTNNRRDKLGNIIEFRLSFSEYCKIWCDYDKLPGHPWVMSRYNDIGHYEYNNIFIQHNSNNIIESWRPLTDLDKKITEYCDKTGYKRYTVKRMIAKGSLVL